MKVTYKNPGFRHSIDSILLFETDGANSFWSDPLFSFFPQLQREALSGKNPDEQARYLTDTLSAVYEEIKPELDLKTERYNEHFLAYEGQINDAFSEAFDLDARKIFNDLSGYICLNPVSPRFLREKYFDIFYLNSERGALGVSLHEMVHFIWFYVWNRLFGDSYDEYETPSLKWILSEMVVESIMADRRLSSINPYFPREHGGCVYRYFQDMEIDGKNILETMDIFYKDRKMTDFMQTAYEYCRKHEAAIRAHIAESEKK